MEKSILAGSAAAPVARLRSQLQKSFLIAAKQTGKREAFSFNE
jgi:hypothetical protein